MDRLRQGDVKSAFEQFKPLFVEFLRVLGGFWYLRVECMAIRGLGLSAGYRV